MGISAIVLPLRPIDLSREPSFAIGTVRVDPPAYEVIADGRRERLQPQTMRVLVALARRQSEPVSRDEIIASCWGSRIVGDDVINRCISLLRRAARHVGGFAIETIPKGGYRLVEMGEPRPAVTGHARWVFASAFLALAAGVGALLTGQKAGLDVHAPRVEVLAISAASGDADARNLGVEVRNSIANALWECGFPVRVTPGATMAVSADYRLSGEITTHGGIVRAAIRLEDTRLGLQLFSRLFESDVAAASALPDRIAASIASSLTSTSVLMALDRRHPSDQAVTAELMKVLTRDFSDTNPLQSFETVRRIAPKAPNSAIAQVALAMETGFALDQLPMNERVPALIAARRASERARQLAPDVADSHVSWCGLYPSTRIADCEDRIRVGVAADAGGSSGPVVLATILSSTGRIEESIHYARKAIARDPFNPGKLGLAIRVFETAGLPHEAEKTFQHATRYWPEHRMISANRVLGMSAAGSFLQLEKFVSRPAAANIPFDREKVVRLLALRRSGDRNEIRNICTQPELRWLTTHVCLSVLASVGDLETAFAIAGPLYPSLVRETAAEEEALWLKEPGGFPLSFLSAPASASLRRDPRYLEIVERVSLLRYWRTGRLPDFCRTERLPACHIARKGG